MSIGAEPRALRSAVDVESGYMKALVSALLLEKEVENYYLREEALIRERVMLLDQIQSNISEERRCLEIDHQECRSQISTARKNHLTLQCDETKFIQLFHRASCKLDKEEKIIDDRLAWATKRIIEEENELNVLLERLNRSEKDERLLERRELQQFNADQELERALIELKSLENDIEERKQLLDRKHESITQWNQSLEIREKELTRCQDEFRDDLRQLEEDEKRFGIYHGNSKVVPMVSQREVMDDHNMTIERETQCEEIELEDEEDHTM